MAKGNTRTRRGRPSRGQPVDAADVQPSAEDDAPAHTVEAEVAAVIAAVPAQEIPSAELPPPPASAHGDDDPWARPVPRGGRFGRVGQTMIDRGLITIDQLDRALTLQR